MQNAYMSLDSKDCEFTKICAFRHPHHTSTRASIFGGGTKMLELEKSHLQMVEYYF